VSLATNIPADALLGNLCSLDDCASRQQYVECHPELLTVQVVRSLAESVRQRIRVDLADAQRIADAALTIGEVLGDRASLGLALRAKANTLWPRGQCKPATDLLERAIRLFHEAGEKDEEGRTLSTSIQPLILQGDYDSALRNADLARNIFSDSGDKLRLARLEINVANIHHRQERFSEAIASYERAYRQLVIEGDIEAVGVALHNMAACLISLNEFGQAFEVYEQAREFARSNNMPLLASQADYNIAYLFHLRGEYERSLQALRKTRAACGVNGDAYHAALCDLDQSEIYLELNLGDEAVDTAARAAEQFERLGMGYEAARSLTNLAIGYSQRSDVQTATGLFVQAKMKFVAEKHRAGEAFVDLYRAMYLHELGNHEGAKELCQAAAAYFTSEGLTRKVVLCDLLMSRIALAARDLPVARGYCEAALTRLQGIEAPILEFRAHLTLGEIADAAGDTQQSYLQYETARNQMESLRCGLQAEELKISFMQNKLAVYDRLIQHTLRGGLTGPSAEDSLCLMERVKSRSLMDALLWRAKLGTANEASTTDLPTKEIQQLRVRLNSHYRRIEEEQLRQDGISARRVEQLWADVRSDENALLRLSRESSSSGAWDFQLRQQAVLSLTEIRAALNRDTTLIEYYQLNDRLLVAVLTSDSLEIVPLATLSAIKPCLRKLQLHLAKVCENHETGGRLESASLRATTRHLKDLYECLIAPIEPLLKGRHIVVVPHGPLHDLPVHALFDGNEYLIDRFTISYAPSASVHSLCQRLARPDSKRSLILGFDDAKAPWIRREVEELAGILPSACLRVGKDATLAVLQEMAPECGTVHIASHGHFRRDNPLFSSVRLGDSFLSVYDLYSLRLPVDLLTLSGCGTGLSFVAAGDELLGLARGLLYAGAHTLLLTLWDVYDRSTAELVRLFYSHLQAASDNKAEALRSAMLELRDANPHPFYWAPLMLVGKNT
jgi:CHAT domain-containing protein/tetratricopeptide (TPR) repeat protein